MSELASEGILPGGCYPPSEQRFPRLPQKWPDKCWPPLPPAPEPDPGEDGPGTLSEPVDWMTYTHPELYKMVHEGMDLTEAMSVSAGWAKLGDELSEMGDELAELLSATAAAWQGPAAELAKGSVTALAEWATQTGANATEVSGAITREVDAANTARNTMPAPVYRPIPFPMPEPVPGPLPKQPIPLQTAAGTTPSSADFASAPDVFRDPGFAPIGMERHQQAARVMQTFQHETNDIYGTVPQFAQPDLSKQPRTPEQPPVEPPKQPPQPQPTSPAQPAPGGAVGAVGGGVGSGPAPGSSTSTPRPGAGVAAGELDPARPAAASAAGGAKSSGGPGGMGGVPMGGMGAGRGGEDLERKASPYLEEDEDLWGLGDNKATPPVIGEDRRRA